MKSWLTILQLETANELKLYEIGFLGAKIKIAVEVGKPAIKFASQRLKHSTILFTMGLPLVLKLVLISAALAASILLGFSPSIDFLNVHTLVTKNFANKVL